jgi:hypothetical protein
LRFGGESNQNESIRERVKLREVNKKLNGKVEIKNLKVIFNLLMAKMKNNLGDDGMSYLREAMRK